MGSKAFPRYLDHASFTKQIPPGDSFRAFKFYRDGVPVPMVGAVRHHILHFSLTGNFRVRDIMGNQAVGSKTVSKQDVKIGPCDPILLIGRRITAD